MVTISLMGGLGNQMFQYAYARSLQLDLDTDLLFDISFYETRKERDLSLLKFKLIPTLRFKYLPKAQLYKGYCLDRISRKYTAKTLLKKQFLFWPENCPFPYSINLDRNKDVNLYGYWQGEGLFRKHRDTIKKELRVSTDVSEEDKKMIAEMQSTESVCVHIRRGDYVGLNWLVCDTAYYEKAAKLITEKLEKPVFYIFSDDTEWVKENIHLPEGYEVIFADDGKHLDYEIMRLMYSCNNFIISNSTFSWWGQYLSYNKDKVVIAPKKWMNDNNNYDFMYFDDWITL